MLANIVGLKKNIIVTGSHGKTTTTSLLANILVEAGLDPTVINGGVINPVWIDDLTKGLWLALRSRENGIFHFAGPDSMNFRDLILLIGETMERAVNIESSNETLVQRNAAICDRAANILGYSPTVSLKTGLRRIYHSLKSG